MLVWLEDMGVGKQNKRKMSGVEIPVLISRSRLPAASTNELLSIRIPDTFLNIPPPVLEQPEPVITK